MAKRTKTGGREKGTPNRLTKELRQTIDEIINENVDKVKQDFEKLEPKDRIKIFVDLLQYAIPKYQSIQATVESIIPLLPETLVINVLDTGYKIAETEEEIKLFEKNEY